MSHRFRASVSEVLAEKAVASQEGAVEALAVAAARQQQRQAALAYMLLLYHGLQYADNASADTDTADGDCTQRSKQEGALAAVSGGAHSLAAYEISSLRVGTAAQVQAQAESLLLQRVGQRVSCQDPLANVYHSQA